MTEIEEIKKRIAKPATVFSTGGFRPTSSVTESWIGRVYLCREDEDLPNDSKGKSMFPLCQLCLDGLLSLPESLADTTVLTVFISADHPMKLTPNGEDWELREYRQGDSLVVKDLVNKDSCIKPFPLRPGPVVDDYPLRGDGELTGVLENQSGHKVGGYPGFCQSEIDFGDGFDFVFQIDSDSKAHLNIVDRGAFYFAKNAATGEWMFYCDFF